MPTEAEKVLELVTAIDDLSTELYIVTERLRNHDMPKFEARRLRRAVTLLTRDAAQLSVSLQRHCQYED